MTMWGGRNLSAPQSRQYSVRCPRDHLVSSLPSQWQDSQPTARQLGSL